MCMHRWSTHWFHVMATVPDEWAGQEVRLRWDSGGEAMIWINSEPQQVYSVTTACFSCFHSCRGSLVHITDIRLELTLF